MGYYRKVVAEPRTLSPAEMDKTLRKLGLDYTPPVYYLKRDPLAERI